MTDALGIALAKNPEPSKTLFIICDPRIGGVLATPNIFSTAIRRILIMHCKTIRRAIAGGAERVILCDTNGGTMPGDSRDLPGGRAGMSCAVRHPRAQ